MINMMQNLFMKIDEIKGMNLRRLRKKANLTQKEIGDYFNDSEGNVSAMEHGKRTLTDRKIEILCEKLNYKYFEFFIEDEDPVIKEEDEKSLLHTYREAKELGGAVAEKIPQYGRFLLTEIKKPQKKDINTSRKTGNKTDKK